MSSTLALTGDIADAINGAKERNRALALSYIDDEGYPSVSYRGGTFVLDDTRVAIWVRKRDGGLLKALADRPKVAMAYHNSEAEGVKLLTLKGSARVDESVADEVYSSIHESERAQDPDRKGIPVVIDVDSVKGFGPGGFFVQTAAGGA